MAAERAARHEGAARSHASAATMRSPVNWALLGLVIERPSYAYELAQRFERTYGSVLELSNVGHVYTAIGTLSSRGLVREIPGSREGRQPKPRYEATEDGIEQYAAWLVSQAVEDRRQQELFVLALGAFARAPTNLLDVVDRCERAWLAQGTRTRISAGRATATGNGPLLEELLAEETRLTVGAKLQWARYARQQLSTYKASTNKR